LFFIAPATIAPATIAPAIIAPIIAPAIVSAITPPTVHATVDPPAPSTRMTVEAATKRLHSHYLHRFNHLPAAEKNDFCDVFSLGRNELTEKIRTHPDNNNVGLAQLKKKTHIQLCFLWVDCEYGNTKNYQFYFLVSFLMFLFFFVLIRSS
jgi:hypothetical protein